MDVHNAAQRRFNMSRIKGIHTKPEILVRKSLHAAGLRFRLHSAALPGKPDIVLPRYNAVLMVNGCFWHGHACPLFRMPATRTEFWRAKIDGNVLRDNRNIQALIDLSWRVGVVWECSLKGAMRKPPGVVGTACAEFVRGGEPFFEISCLT